MSTTNTGFDLDKFFLKSKTIWGAIIAAAPTILETLGAGGLGELFTDLNAPVATAIDNFAVALGSILVVWGRITAKGAVKIK